MHLALFSQNRAGSRKKKLMGHEGTRAETGPALPISSSWDTVDSTYCLKFENSEMIIWNFRWF